MSKVEKQGVSIAMKKLLLALSLLTMSSSCFAIVNFTSSTGTLVMRDVSVDGTTLYDSVTLKLDLANGTFSVVDATLKDNLFSETVLSTITKDGIKVDFYGCALSGKNQITCKTKVISINRDTRIDVWGTYDPGYGGGNASLLYDDLSNQYSASTVTALDNSNSGYLSFNIIQGIPVEVKFIYNNINTAATSISAFQPLFTAENGTSVSTVIRPDFRDIEF